MSSAPTHVSRARAQPGALAWIGRGRPVPAALAGVSTRFDDSDDFLLAPRAYEFDFYVVHLEQRGVRGLDLLRLIRRASAAGVLVLGRGGAGELAQALDSGADMLLARGATDDDVCAAVAAVHRRSGPSASPGLSGRPWTLLEQSATLQAPDGTGIALSQSDLALVKCFADSKDGKVDRQVLVERLWGARAGSMENALHATVYRLRKRIEQAGQALVPVHSVAKVGYEFRAPLVRA